MVIKTHVENHGITVTCCVCRQGYELIPSETVPYTHEAYRNGEHLGVICCDCYVAGESWLRTMLALPAHEPIIETMRPRYLEIETGQFEGPADRCATCELAIPDDDADVIVHLPIRRDGVRIMTLSHRACVPTYAVSGPGTARLCVLEAT